MRKLYLVRHGQTLFNLKGRTQGWCDSPLTDLGIEQAKMAGKFFKDHNIEFDEAYSSTSERACDTLELITDIPYKRVKGLKEWNFGMMEGEPEILQKVPRRPDQLTHENFFVTWGGESDKDLKKRLNDTIDNIVRNSNGKSLLMVSHGGAMWIYYLSKAENPKKEDAKLFGNCAIMECDIDDDNNIHIVKIHNPANTEAVTFD